MKDILVCSSNNLHSVFYENNKQNSLNSNSFFQTFGLQKNPQEKTIKFQINNSDNNSTFQIGNNAKKREDFSDTTQKIAQPKIFTKSRDELLSRKAISSLNFFQQCSKASNPPISMDSFPTKNRELHSNKKENALNQLLTGKKITKKYCLKDLIDE